MRDYLNIGSSPHGEDCAQVGSDDYNPRMRAETTAFVHQLQRMFGAPPYGAAFRVKGFPHDFGSYYEVVVAFDDAVEDSVKFAYQVENNTPESWDDEARKELAAAGFPVGRGSLGCYCR